MLSRVQVFGWGGVPAEEFEATLALAHACEGGDRPLGDVYDPETFARAMAASVGPFAADAPPSLEKRASAGAVAAAVAAAAERASGGVAPVVAPSTPSPALSAPFAQLSLASPSDAAAKPKTRGKARK